MTWATHQPASPDSPSQIACPSAAVLCAGRRVFPRSLAIGPESDEYDSGEVETRPRELSIML